MTKPLSLAEHFRQQEEFKERWLQDHRAFVRQKALVDAVCEHLMSLEGPVLDGYLRELGFDPDELLQQFNKAFGIEDTAVSNGER